MRAELSNAECIKFNEKEERWTNESNAYIRNWSVDYIPKELIVSSVINEHIQMLSNQVSGRVGVNPFQHNISLESNGSTENSIRSVINTGHSQNVELADINEKLGLFVTGTCDGEIIIWDLKTRRVNKTISVGKKLGGLGLRDDGCLFVSCGYLRDEVQEIRAYDTRNGKKFGATLCANVIGPRNDKTYRPSVFLFNKNILFELEPSSAEITQMGNLDAAIFDSANNTYNIFRRLPLPQLEANYHAAKCRKSIDGDSVVIQTQRTLQEPTVQNSNKSRDLVDLRIESDYDLGKRGRTGPITWGDEYVYNPHESTWLKIPNLHPSESILAESDHFRIVNDGGDTFCVLKSTTTKGDIPYLIKSNRLPRKVQYLDDINVLVGHMIFNFDSFKLTSFPQLRFAYRLLMLHSENTILYSTPNDYPDNLEMCFKTIKLDSGQTRSIIQPNTALTGRFVLGADSSQIIDSSGCVVTSSGEIGKRITNGDPLVYSDISNSQDGNTVVFNYQNEAFINQRVGTEWNVTHISKPALGVGPYLNYSAVSPNQKRVAFAGFHRSDGGEGIVVDLSSGSIQRFAFDRNINSGSRELIGTFWIDDDRIALCSGTSVDFHSISNPNFFERWEANELNTEFHFPWNWSIDRTHQRLFYLRKDNGLEILDVSDAKPRLVATLHILDDKEWIIETPDYSYMGTSNGADNLHFLYGSYTVYPFEQFDLRLNRPDVVLGRLGAPPEAITIAKELREKRLKRMGVTEDMLKPDFHLPEISFAKELPVATDSRDLSLQIKATDSKYPLERLRVYVNDVPVNGKDGETLRALNTQSLDRSIPVNLSAGENKIQVSVLNSAGAESLYATAEVNCSAPTGKPILYVVALGVSNYANQQFNLKYAAKDAEDLAAKLKSRAGDAYGEVKELLLKDGEVTKDSLAKVREFLKSATVDDSVVLFMAGHGLLDEKYDYYFGTSDMDFNNPAGRGIAFDDMDDILAEIPSRKKSLLMDTCHAGELDADEKKILAAADAAASGAPILLASNKSVAVRSVGTRGMAVKGIEGAKGKSEWYERISGMFVDLRRGSGSTILSSSAGAEYAFESGEQKNGLFTYAVLEALDGKNAADADKDGKVTMKELCESAKKRVQELSGGKQTPNTRRLNLESDFPLATTK